MDPGHCAMCCPIAYIIHNFTVHTNVLFSSSDVHRQNGLYLLVVLNNVHNHPLHCANVLRFRDVSDETRAEVVRLFEAGHSPSTARDVLQYELHAKHGDDYIFAAADRALCPDVQYCFR